MPNYTFPVRWAKNPCFNDDPCFQELYGRFGISQVFLLANNIKHMNDFGFFIDGEVHPSLNCFPRNITGTL